ncbi:MAG TPA: CerR family C-terminal domain-containing protein [Deferrisomatales bacterium]|nr:CerR family C-terminal domain-containing protein [Deferrisomatales bacterium]
MSKEEPNPTGTRARLLAAAERLFADRGYDGTSVRDVTEAAGANVAAVNYHFGGKERLYLEVFGARTAEMTALREQALACATGEAGPSGNVAAVLRAFVGSCLHNLMSPGGSDCFPRLVFREMASPGPAFEYLVENIAEPNHRVLRGLILGAAPGLSEEQALLCVASVFGQMLHFVRARRMIERLGGRSYDAEFVDQICEHVVRFSLGGIEGVS